MLKYLIQTTEQLILMAISVGIMLGYVRLLLGEKAKRVMQVTLLTGFVLSAVMAILKNTTAKIETGRWNLWIFGLYLLMFLLFLLFGALGRKWEKMQAVLPVFLAVLVTLAIFYALPDALAYPYAIYTGERTFLSTNYLYKLIGMLGGLLLVFLTGLAVYKGSVRLEKKKIFVLLFFAELIVVIRQITSSNKYENTQSHFWDHTAAGPVLRHSAVCEGIAKLFLFLCQRLELPCAIVMGRLEGEGHAWNMIELSGRRMYIDVTELVNTPRQYLLTESRFFKSREKLIQSGYTW